MKKIVLLIATLLATLSYASAYTCTDLQKNVARTQESSSVLALQNFLFEKGYLKATPNGYFGVGTFAAVKMYQKSLGVEQVGSTGPFTRAAIKKETCSISSSSVVTTKVATSTPSAALVPAVKVVAPSVPLTPSSSRNVTRRADLEKILKVLYAYFSDSRGVYPVTVKPDIFTELCVRPKLILTEGTSTEVAVVETPVSTCLDYMDVAHLVPNYVQAFPRDPLLATSSILTGYAINRSENNDIMLTALRAEDGAIVKAICNFNGYCGTIKHISSIIYKTPMIASTSVNLILRDAWPKKEFTIYGTNFTATNTVTLLSNYTGKSYTLGTFASINGTSFEVLASSTNQFFSCGGTCQEKIPLGDYVLTVTNQGGVTGPAYIVIKGYTASAFSARTDAPILPKSKNVKLGSFTISSGVPIVLTSLVLTSTTTSVNLPAKITKLILKDPLSGQTFAASGLSFSLPSVPLYENQSNVYELYADFDEVLVLDSGSMVYGGTFTASNSITGVVVDLPAKEITFTVSY